MRDLEPKDWRNVGDIVELHKSHPERDDAVYRHYLAAAYRGEIAWEKDKAGVPTGHGKIARLKGRNLSNLLEAMAREAVTNQELRATFNAMDHAWANGRPGDTGRGGDILLERGAGTLAQPPLPANWEDACVGAIGSSGGKSGGFWALHMINAHRRRGMQPPDAGHGLG